MVFKSSEDWPDDVDLDVIRYYMAKRAMTIEYAYKRDILGHVDSEVVLIFYVVFKTFRTYMSDVEIG